jgi:hypothetical protein
MDHQAPTDSFDTHHVGDSYARDGYVIIRNVGDPALIRAAEAHVQRTIAAHPDRLGRKVNMNFLA